MNLAPRAARLTWAEDRFRPLLWAIVVAGILAATALALSTHGDPYDMESFRLVRDGLDRGPLQPYAFFAQQGIVRWPYPPAFFPWISFSGALAGHGLGSFEFLLRVPSIAADAALAWAVQDFLGLGGASARTRLAAAALISLGPSFLAISGYHGQFDALAILPGVLAVRCWERPGTTSRALSAGLLIGLGSALKTVPLLLLLALLPSVRSRREAVTLVAAAMLPLLVVFAPFALAGTLPSTRVLAYRGVPGAGGVSLLIQPDLAGAVLGTGTSSFSGLSEALARHGSLLVLAGLAAVAAVGGRSRARSVDMAVLLWLAVYAFGVNFFFQYVLWGLPFFLMAGYVRKVAVAQAVLVVPTLIFYLRPWHRPVVAVIYAAAMLLLLASTFGGFALTARRLLASRRAAPDAVV